MCHGCCRIVKLILILFLGHQVVSDFLRKHNLNIFEGVQLRKPSKLLVLLFFEFFLNFYVKKNFFHTCQGYVTFMAFWILDLKYTNF